MKFDKYLKIINVFYGCVYVKVIYFFLLNWRNKNVGRDVFFKVYLELMIILMDFVLY